MKKPKILKGKTNIVISVLFFVFFEFIINFIESSKIMLQALNIFGGVALSIGIYFLLSASEYG